MPNWFRRAREAQREVTPLAMYRAGLVDWPGPEVTPLEMYGAKRSPDFSGWWVYALADKEGRVWRAGQSSRLWSRWRDYFYTYGERFTASDKWLIPVANEAEADLIELVLIHFYDPECNTKGRRADLEAKVRAWGRGTQQYKRGEGWPDRLDQKQVTP